MDVRRPFRALWRAAGKLDDAFGRLRVFSLVGGGLVALFGLLLFTYGWIGTTVISIGIFGVVFGSALSWAGSRRLSVPPGAPPTEPQSPVATPPLAELSLPRESVLLTEALQDALTQGVDLRSRLPSPLSPLRLGRTATEHDVREWTARVRQLLVNHPMLVAVFDQPASEPPFRFSAEMPLAREMNRRLRKLELIIKDIRNR